MQTYTWIRGDFTVTTDPSGIDLKKAAALIARQDWCCKDRPLDLTVKAIQNSETFFCLAGENREVVGFVRLITDYATAAYVTDVNIAPEYKGRGLSKFIFSCIMEHPVFCKLRRMLLCTPDAHGLYAKYDFKPVAHPEEFMERLIPYDEAYAHFEKNKNA